MKDYEISWKGEAYRIPANNVIPVIAKVESIITLPELQSAVDHDTVPLAKLSMAFGVILRHAGATVTDREVWSGMFGKNSEDNALAATLALLTLMIPPEYLPRAEGETIADAKKKKTAKAASSSKKPSKPPSPGE